MNVFIIIGLYILATIYIIYKIRNYFMKINNIH